ncbi:hypothetical protein M9H77_36734 [Catharanthus roseus]|uniref:Uncharacterized protein n=1 Tax=Catharanthus roseus TaxID=4058 RepID=A0ACB9ZUH6_CATRO|nr:hypothetical protein M9H77_36734 [Catharanthus roseus]
MEEVPTHVHPDPIAPDLQSEEGTLGSMDPESVYLFRDPMMVLSCALFVWLPYLDRALIPSDLWQAKLRENDHTYWVTQHASHIETWYQWLLRIRDGPALAAETSMLQEVDDMASVVIQEPPTDPS